MAFNPVPTSFFGAGFSANSTAHTITFNTADAVTPALPELTDAEADATTGDWRKILFALMERIYEQWTALDPADVPTRVRVFRNTTSGDTTLTRNYIINIDTEIVGDEDVADE